MTRPLSLSRLALAVSAVALVGVFTFAGSAARAQDHEGEEEGPLHLAMEELQSGQRKLRKMLADPAQKDATIELLRGMQAHAITAFQNPQPAPAALAADKTPAFDVGFKRQILRLCDQLLVVELAVAEDRADDVKTGYAELGKIKKEGHNEYQPEE